MKILYFHRHQFKDVNDISQNKKPNYILQEGRNDKNFNTLIPLMKPNQFLHVNEEKELQQKNNHLLSSPFSIIQNLKILPKTEEEIYMKEKIKKKQEERRKN